MTVPISSKTPNFGGEKNSKSWGGAIQWIALVVLIAAMFSAGKRAAMPALFAVLRFMWPFLVVWLVWRFLKGKVSSVVGKFQAQVMDAANQQGGVAGGFAGGFAGAAQRAAASRKTQGDVIDLCPKCGSLLAAGHRCNK
ncbi:MAG: hypothetical protein NTV34_14915 [Proteobacteria bacterium]|nr:hypothetical protein [Pseudomonadota bacterium]